MDLSPVYQIPSLQTAAFVAKIHKLMTKRSDQNDLIFEFTAKYLQDFDHKIGTPMAEWDQLIEGEPPQSQKMNEFYTNADVDVTILRGQLDALSKSAIACHNLIRAEVISASHSNARLSNKLKTLQLYSANSDNNMFVFGDSFMSDELVDKAMTGSATIGTVSDGAGSLTLATESSRPNILAGATVMFGPLSNGVPGNNVELAPSQVANIKSPSGADQPASIPTSNIIRGREFVGEKAKHADTNAMLDGQPNTWFEFENIRLTKEDKNKALGLNFSYIDDIYSNSKNMLAWGNGPTRDILSLETIIQLKTPAVLNTFNIYAQELKDKGAYPVKIVSLHVSGNGVDWTLISPSDVWLSHDANLYDIDTASNISIGRANWKFEPKSVTHIRIVFEQHKPFEIEAGHIYYTTKPSTIRVEGATPNDDGFTWRNEIVQGKRQEGPIPPASNPYKYLGYGSSNFLVSDVENFIGDRWAIAIRDLSADEIRYANKSTIVSKRFDIPGIIDKVMLEADVDIPSVFSTSSDWVKFYISPDDGLTWHRISRVEDVYVDVPEILSFNSTLPDEFKEPTVGYYNTSKPATSVRLKIELSRPTDETTSDTTSAFNFSSYTPAVRGYRIKIRTKD